MTYTDDRTSLESYLATGSAILEPEADSVVILYKVLTEILSILSNIQTINSKVAAIDVDQSTAGNQTTIINRLTNLDDSLDTINTNVGNINTSNSDLVTEIQTGSIKTQLDNLITELKNGDIKLTSDQILAKLGQIYTSITVLENKLYGLHPTDGINGSLLQLITDIRDKLVVELVDKPTELKIVLNDQIMVSGPVIKNIPLSTANVEYSVVLPVGTRRFSIKSRLDTGDANGIIRYAYVSGIVANAVDIGDNSYYTVGQYVEDEEENLVLEQPLAIYFASPIPNVVVTVKYWGAAPVQTYSPRTTPKLSSVILVSANTEYTVQIPAGAKKYTIKTRDNNGDNNGIIRAAYVPGVVAEGLILNGNSYTTIQDGMELQEYNVVLNDPLDIYLASDTPNLPITVEYWS